MRPHVAGLGIHLPALRGEAPRPQREPAPLTAAEARQRAQDEGFAEGRRSGNWNSLADWYDRYEPP